MAQPQTIRMNFISKTILPELSRGKTSDRPTITVVESGQFVFNTLASQIIGIDKVAFSFNEKTREIYIMGATAANVKKFGLKDDALFSLKQAKKGKTYNVAVSSLLQCVDVFGEGGLYDYKGSGNQTFPAVGNEKENYLVFQLPAGTLSRKPVSPRKPRTKKTDIHNGAIPLATEQTETETDEPMLTLSE